MQALQVKLVGFGVVRVFLCNPLPLRIGELETQHVHNLTRDFFLDGGNVGEIAIVLFSPYMMVVTRIRQLDADDQVTSSFRVFAGQNGSYLEFTAKRSRIDFSASVPDDGTSGYDFQIGQL